jgi:hypothetical protein
VGLALGVALPAITAAEAAILAERFMAEPGQLPSQGKINIEMDPRGPKLCSKRPRR